MRRLRTYLVATIVVVIAGGVATILSASAPVLGLDLQGGISVAYAPVGKFNSASLDETLNIINTRVNTFGVAEPDISRQGNDIIVELPGVKDRSKALRLVGRTAQLAFRPVLADVPAVGAISGATKTTTTTVSPARKQAVLQTIASCNASQISSLVATGIDVPTTPIENANDKNACVVLPIRNSKQRLLLGPVNTNARLRLPRVLTGND